MGVVWMVVYVAAVVLLAGRATGAVWTVTAAEQPDRGWFPGGEEEPEPAPQPEQHTPSWARP
jgi:hypothetical protein